MLAALAGRPGAAMSKNAAVKVFEKSVFDFFAEKSVVVSEQIVPTAFKLLMVVIHKPIQGALRRTPGAVFYRLLPGALP